MYLCNDVVNMRHNKRNIVNVTDKQISMRIEVIKTQEMKNKSLSK